MSSLTLWISHYLLNSYRDGNDSIPLTYKIKERRNYFDKGEIDG